MNENWKRSNTLRLRQTWHVDLQWQSCSVDIRHYFFIHKSAGLKLNFPVQHCQVDKRKLALILAQEGLTFNPHTLVRKMLEFNQETQWKQIFVALLLYDYFEVGSEITRKRFDVFYCTLLIKDTKNNFYSKQRDSNLFFINC